MAKISMLCFMLVLLATGTLLSSVNGTVVANCQTNLPELIAQCRQFVVLPGPTIPPSQACCNVVAQTDVPCACEHITPDIEKIISMSKVVFVAEKCGRPLPHGTKCGSYTVPLA